MVSGRELWRTKPVFEAGNRGKGTGFAYANLHFTPDGDLLNVTFAVPEVRRGSLRYRTYGHQVRIRDGGGVGAAATSKPEEATWYAGGVFSADGKWLHLRRGTERDARVRILDMQSRRHIGPDFSGSVVASSAASSRVLLMRRAVGNDFFLVLAAADTGRSLGKWLGSAGMFSADGSKLLISGSILTNWVLVDALTGRVLIESPRYTGRHELGDEPRRPATRDGAGRPSGDRESRGADSVPDSRIFNHLGGCIGRIDHGISRRADRRTPEENRHQLVHLCWRGV